MDLPGGSNKRFYIEEPIKTTSLTFFFMTIDFVYAF